MNILLVDDDSYVIETLQKNIDWNSIQIDNVYTAYSVSKAKQIIEDVPIQLIVCDIEMPKEDGFTLLRWIREKNYIIKVILLTSYAEFEYANQAIKMNCFAYALKPIVFEELEALIRNAMAAVKEALETVNYKKYYAYWSASEKLRKENFWYELLFKADPKDTETIGKLLQANGLDYAGSQKFAIISIEYFENEKEGSNYQKGMFEWNIKSLSFATFSGEHTNVEAVIYYQRGTLLAVIEVSGTESQEEILKAARIYISKAMVMQGIDCYITLGDIRDIYHIAEHVQQMMQMRESRVLFEEHIITYQEGKHIPNLYKAPDFTLWENFVRSAQETPLNKAIDEYLDSLVKNNKIDKDILEHFVSDYLQMLGSVMKQNNIMIANMEEPFIEADKVHKALRSVANTKKYLKETLKIVIAFFGQEESISIGWKVKDYIDHNLDKDISRESLAEMVFINQDYLSRVFKKDIGESIGNYIQNKRIQVAKEYLERTNEPVNSIATKVGYDNFSYFSKVFKGSVGLTPKDYRKAKEENNTPLKL
ncbi:MAG: helix-turn-helix domain-containing protein [Mobilitalea sp.]